MRKIGTLAMVVAMMGTAAPIATVAAEETVTLQFSSQSVPADHHTKAIYKFEELVEASSGGSVEVEVFDSGSLMDQNAEQTALLRGDIAMAYTSSQWLSERVPAASIVGTCCINKN